MTLERLGPEAERGRLTERVGSGGEAEDFGLVAGQQLARQAGLAHAGIGDDHHDPELASGGPGQLGFERGQFLVPSHQGRTPGSGEPSPFRGRPAAGVGLAGSLLPLDGHGGEGLGEPLQGEPPDGREAEPAPGADQAGEQIAGQDLTPLGPVTEPLGDHHGGAEEVVLLLDRLTGVEADPHAERLVGTLLVVRGDGPLHGHGAADGLEGTGEGNHQPVPQTLDLLAPEVGDRGAQQGEVHPPELLGAVVTETVEQPRSNRPGR